MGRRWAVVVAVVGVALAITTLADPLVFLADDSWFYLVIGRNIAAGHGITFSQVMPTNGFQPLWGSVVAAVALVARIVGVSSAVGEMRMVLAVGWAVLGVAIWRLDRLLVRLAVPPAGVGLVALAVLAFLGGPLATAGSEANLVFLFVVMVTDRTATEVLRGAPTLATSVTWGLLVGLMVLARLDTGFLALAAFGAVAVGGVAPPAARFRTAVVGGLASAAVVGPYLVSNVIRFGHLLPISGEIKLDYSRVWFTPLSIGWTGWALLGVIAVFAVGAFAFRRPTRLELAAFLVPLAGGLATTAIYFTWSPGRFTDLDWYRMPQLVAAAVACGITVRRLAGWQPQAVRIGVPAAAGVLVLLLFVVQVDRRMWGANHDFWHPVARFSSEIADHVPPGGIVATVDYPGVVGAYSGRRVVAIDGLTGDYRFQDDLRDLGGCALSKRGVGWLLVDDESRLRPGDRPGRYRVGLASWLHKTGGGDLEVDRATDLVVADPETGLSLWRIHPDCPPGP